MLFYFEISIWNNQVSGKFDRIVFLIGLLEGKSTDWEEEIAESYIILDSLGNANSDDILENEYDIPDLPFNTYWIKFHFIY